MTFQQSPLLSVSGDLEPILQNICDLVFFNELVREVDNGSAFHDLLNQNIEDSCNWVSTSYKSMYIHV